MDSQPQLNISSHASLKPKHGKESEKYRQEELSYKKHMARFTRYSLEIRQMQRQGWTCFCRWNTACIQLKGQATVRPQTSPPAEPAKFSIIRVSFQSFPGTIAHSSLCLLHEPKIFTALVGFLSWVQQQNRILCARCIESNAHPGCRVRRHGWCAACTAAPTSPDGTTKSACSAWRLC